MLLAKHIKVKIITLYILLISPNVSTQTPLNQTVNPSKNTTETLTTNPSRIATDLKKTISGTIGLFDPWIGVSYERLFFSRWGIDASLGIIGGSIGTKFYFPKVSEGKVSFLIGLSEGILLLIGTKHYVPAGITYLSNKGFRFSIDFGPQIYHDPNEEIQFGMSIKLGKSF